MAYWLALIGVTVGWWTPVIWFVATRREHPRYRVPDVVTDVPNCTFHGGLV